MWPSSTFTTTAVTSLCTPTTLKTCIAASTQAATIASLPTISSCYTGSALTADTLTNQAQTACTSSYFCKVNKKLTLSKKFILFYLSHCLKAVFTGTSGTTATGVTLSCESAACASSATQLCSMVANTNQVLGCYTGQKVTVGTSTWAKSICAPVNSASAAYCQVSIFFRKFDKDKKRILKKRLRCKKE